MTHYAGDAVLASKAVVELDENLDGTLRGKAALRELFVRGSRADPSCTFLRSTHFTVSRSMRCITSVSADDTA